jgi:hypothetical protein
MMKRDAERTKAAKYVSKKSYFGTDGHEYLYGRDRGPRRHELYLSCQGQCFVCGKFAPEEGHPGFHGEVHHTRCYCLGCIEWRCGQLAGKCHRHRTEGFIRKVKQIEAHADFQELYKEST